jgi:hypothetical protein
VATAAALARPGYDRTRSPGTSVAPTAGGTETSVAATGGGTWRNKTPEEQARFDALIKQSKSGNQLLAAAAKQALHLTEATAPGGGKAEAAKPAEAIEAEQQRHGNVAAIALAGAGVIGTGIAIARGGAWWLSLLLFAAAGGAYYYGQRDFAFQGPIDRSRP